MSQPSAAPQTFRTALSDNTPVFHLVSGEPDAPTNLYLTLTPAPDGDTRVALDAIRRALVPGWEIRAQALQDPPYNPALGCTYFGWDIESQGRIVSVYRRVELGSEYPTDDLRGLIGEARALLNAMEPR